MKNGILRATAVIGLFLSVVFWSQPLHADSTENGRCGNMLEACKRYCHIGYPKAGQVSQLETCIEGCQPSYTACLHCDQIAANCTDECRSEEVLCLSKIPPFPELSD